MTWVPCDAEEIALTFTQRLQQRIATLEEALKQTSGIDEASPTRLPPARHMNWESPVLNDSLNVRNSLPSFRTSSTRQETPLASQRDHHRSRIQGGYEELIQQHQIDQGGPSTERQMEDHGHLQIDDTGGPNSSRFFGDAATLYLMVSGDESSLLTFPKNQPPRDEPVTVETAPYSFRNGWVESFAFEQDSALRTQHTVEGIRAELPRRDEGEKLVRLYFEVRPG